VGEGHALTLVDDFSRGKTDAALEALCARPGVALHRADLTRPGALDALPRDWEQVYMLAAVVGVRHVERDPARVIRVNTMALLHVLEWLPGRGETLFFSSTSEAYAGGVTNGTVPVPTPEDVPSLTVWPVAQVGVPFSAVVSATSEVEVVGRVDTPARAVARLSHHLSSVARARIDPDVEYLDRAVAAYRAELRRRRDRAAAWGGATRAA